MRRWRLRMAAGGLGLILVAAGCGGSKAVSQSPSPKPTVSQKQYQQQLGAICASAEKQFDGLKAPADGASLSQASAYINQAAGLLDQMVDRMAAVQPPKAEQAKFQSAIAQARHVVTEMSKDFGHVDRATPSQLEAAATNLGKATDNVGQAFKAAGAPASCNS